MIMLVVSNKHLKRGIYIESFTGNEKQDDADLLQEVDLQSMEFDREVEEMGVNCRFFSCDLSNLNFNHLCVLRGPCKTSYFFDLECKTKDFLFF